MSMYNLRWVEKEIERLAREIGLKEKHVRLMFSGVYEGLWVVHYASEGTFGLVARRSDVKRVTRIKVAKEEKHEAIKKMRILAKLFMLYRTLKRAEQLERELELLEVELGFDKQRMKEYQQEPALATA